MLEMQPGQALQGKQQQEGAEATTVICPDTEAVSVTSTASSSDLVSRIAAETDSDSDIGEIIPQLDGPAEETLGLTSEKEAMEEDSIEEAERDISHLPTANDPDNILQHWMKNINQEKIENMSQ